MKITILAIGKNRTDLHEKAIMEYRKRLSRYTKIDMLFLPGSTTIQESQAIESRIGQYELAILLDEKGSMWSTPEIAHKIEDWQNESMKSVVFIIGGAHGVTQELKNKVDFMWSITNLVLPHELVRLLLIEQLYRCYNLINGGKYHHW